MFALEEVQRLRDEALIERLTRSVRNDRRLTARLLVELGEVQARELYREQGFSSMFDFATRGLGMSEAEAALRLRAARLGRSFPIALELLERSEVNLTTLSLLAPVLTPDNLELLYAARFKSKAEVMTLVAAHCPKPDARDSVRPTSRARDVSVTEPLPARPTQPSASGRTPPEDPGRDKSESRPTIGSGTTSARASQVDPNTSPEPTPTPTLLDVGTRADPVVGSSPVPAASTSEQHVGRSSERATVLPLSPGRHKISFTGSQRVHDLLREAQDLRRHRYPAGDLEPLFERALELLVAEEKKRKFALTPKPRAPTSTRTTQPGSRHIPNEVRRTVWARDAGQCRFIGRDGQRCAARSRLEFHHVLPFAKGGASNADNIVLLCQSHNALQAERDYGRALMQRCSQQRPAELARGAPPVGNRARPTSFPDACAGGSARSDAHPTRVADSPPLASPGAGSRPIERDFSRHRDRLDDATQT